MRGAELRRFAVRPITDAQWHARRVHARMMLCCAAAGALGIVGLGALFLGI